MRVYIKDNMFVIRAPQIFHFVFDSPENFDKNLNHNVKFIVSCNESLAKCKIKN